MLIYFDYNIWGTVSDWLMVAVTGGTGFLIYKTLRSQKDVQAACKMYGRANVERWIEQGLVIPLKDGAQGSPSITKRLDRLQLEAAAKTANKPYYKKTIEIN